MANVVLKDYLLRGYAINQRLTNIERKIEEHDQKIDFFVRTSLPPVEGIFFDGQIFDAYTFVSDLIRSAKKSIVLFDNYVDDTVLAMLDYPEGELSTDELNLMQRRSEGRKSPPPSTPRRSSSSSRSTLRSTTPSTNPLR